jgi:hypothetical protein
MFGSIFSALLLLGSPVYKLNEYLMKKDIVDKYKTEFKIGFKDGSESAKKLKDHFF